VVSAKLGVFRGERGAELGVFRGERGDLVFELGVRFLHLHKRIRHRVLSGVETLPEIGRWRDAAEGAHQGIQNRPTSGGLVLLRARRAITRTACW
jgi:hypothetical protein